MSYEIPKINDIVIRTEKGAIKTKIEQDKRREDEFLKWKLNVIESIKSRADFGKNELNVSGFATSDGISIADSMQYMDKFMEELRNAGYKTKSEWAYNGQHYVVIWPEKQFIESTLVVGGTNTVFGNSNLTFPKNTATSVKVTDNAIIGQSTDVNEIPSIEKIIAQSDEARKKLSEFNVALYEEYKSDAVKKINQCAEYGMKSCNIGFKILKGSGQICPYATKLISDLSNKGYTAVRMGGQIQINW